MPGGPDKPSQDRVDERVQTDGLEARRQISAPGKFLKNVLGHHANEGHCQQWEERRNSLFGEPIQGDSPGKCTCCNLNKKVTRIPGDFFV